MPFMLDRLVQTPSSGSATPNADVDRLLTKSQAWSLYLLHFLFTWNARTYEFAAVGSYSLLSNPCLIGYRLSLLLMYTRTR